MATSARTTRKAPARKATPRAATPAPASPAKFDFGNITVGDAAALPSNGKSAVENTPFPAAVDASWADRKAHNVTIKGVKVQREYGSVKTVTVPASVADKTVRLIRLSADHLDGVGVRVVPGEPDAQGNVTIAFRAQTRRAGSE